MSSHPRSRLVLLAACALATATACRTAMRQVDSAAAPANLRANAHALADSIRTAQKIPGLSVAVMRHGRLLWLDTLGVENLSTSRPVTSTTMFRIGSVSKLITAFTAARLAQQGRLDLDARVRALLPELPAQDSLITPRLLLGHLGGIHHYGRSSYINHTAYASVRASLAKFANDSLVAVPGTKYFYSSYGYVLLGGAMEAATHTPFAELVARATLDPIGMRHTQIDGHLTTGVDTAALFYDAGNAGPEPSPAMDLSDRIPAGGYLSTALDLARFGTSSIEGPLLTPAMRSAMFNAQMTTSGQSVPVGFGWALGRDSAGRRIVFHGGDAIGGRAFLLAYPDDGLVVATAANLGFARFAEKEGMRFGDLFLTP